MVAEREVHQAEEPLVALMERALQGIQEVKAVTQAQHPTQVLAAAVAVPLWFPSTAKR